eukprot:TRINITY_DN29840_c0_g1_i1.p1 TRINITY_DN29840_c0_g1~~TRINITY_DN29840_c0_g1_i1.p1  ORF type:complete len:146 (-),score=30.48 TRINITY_DN29840_c0_g1_i1:41-478(-)
MVRGSLRVLLVDAKGLENTDFLCNMDPYVILTYRSQEKKSSVAQDAGSNPQWNETFVFQVSDCGSDLLLRIMDKDRFSTDDFVGEAIIPLEGVFPQGSLPTAPYNVLLPDKTYCGEIRVALSFQPEEKYAQQDEEEFGGYNQGYL